ncbi:hypothetical protein SteCoe_32089 [Stentor coeruleus]|uniref:Uncharacterized protein n=1 Tax=Stentor coeruleus TaxID=5963 RepID=A0A1R2AZT6_9CILI|nr:hypothetical protein SteCoe_32089 [Stentor coeruleus]
MLAKKPLKKSNSHIPEIFGKIYSSSSNSQQRDRQIEGSKNQHIMNLKLEIQTATQNVLNSLMKPSELIKNPKIKDYKEKIERKPINPRFGDISSILIDRESPVNMSLCEVNAMLGSPMHKRDLSSFVQVSIKYGVRVPKSIAAPPKKFVRHYSENKSISSRSSNRNK